MTQEELLEHVSGRIAERPAMPKEICIVDTLPLTPMGKIFKPAIRWEQTQHVLLETLAPITENGLAVSVDVCENRRYGMSARISLAISDSDRTDKAAIEREVCKLAGQFNVKFESEWV